MLTLLVDTDILIYRAAIRFEHHREESGRIEKSCDAPGAIRYFRHCYEQLLRRLNADAAIACLSASKNWRTKIYADYKANRKQEKPMLYHTLRQYVINNMRKCMRPELEADDVLGILATAEHLVPGQKIVVSSDKDLKTVPCRLYNPDKKDAVQEISIEAAHRQHMMQTLIGDSVDNYKGCPGVGPKRAQKFLASVDPQDYWFAVRTTYECYGASDVDALRNARLAKILTCHDYDFEGKTVRLWEPDG